jgi:hypothetical protein
MLRLNRKLAFIAVPATLALGAVSYGSVVALAAPSPTPPAATQPSAGAPAESSTEQPESGTEQPETGTEAAEANEPALPGGGYADTNSQADTQQEGVH